MRRGPRVRPRLKPFSQTYPRVVLLALQAASTRQESGHRCPPAAPMLPASLLRRPGLGRLMRQARAYAEAAAAPAPAAGPGQMSFTFASPTQVFFNGANVRQVDVPTQTGAFGILAAHVPTLQVLRPGLVVVHAEDGTTSKYFGECSRRAEGQGWERTNVPSRLPGQERQRPVGLQGTVGSRPEAPHDPPAPEWLWLVACRGLGEGDIPEGK